MRKNTWYAVYHQRQLDFLAQSYQPGYFFILMGRKPLTEYLQTNGLNQMLAGATLKFTTGDVGLKAYVTNYLAVSKRDGTGFRPLRLSTLFADAIRHILTSSKMEFKRGATTVAYISDSADELVIPRAGDITLLAGKNLDLLTNEAAFYPKLLSGAAEPVPDVGELLMWRDTANTKCFLMYNCFGIGVMKVELI